MTIGERIRSIRGGVSRTEFAETLGIHPQTVYLYEKDKRVIDVVLLQKICLLYEVSVEWLVFGEENAKVQQKVPPKILEVLKEKDRMIEHQDEQIETLRDELIEAQAGAIKALERALQIEKPSDRNR